MAVFTTITLSTTDVKQSLLDVAQKCGIKPTSLAFDLLGIETSIKSPEHQTWLIINDPIEKLFDAALIKTSALIIKQEYKVRIRRKIANAVEDKIKLSIASNRAKSKVIATFKKGSVFPCDNKLAKILKNMINTQKLRLGFIISHFEEDLNAVLIKLSKNIKCGSVIVKDIKIRIAQSPSAQFAIDDDIIKWYEDKSSEKKSLIEGVPSNKLIFEYIKPHDGFDGRSCSGEMMIVPSALTTYAHYKPDPETVKVLEDTKSIKYYSKIDGYVKDENGIISISREVRMNNANFKNAGLITTGEDRDIAVNIHNEDSSTDAISSGVEIDVKELNVKGTVGAHAKVKATELNVDEQTHKNAQLVAVENAKIHLHRGSLKAKTAEIEILETGTVEADDIYVKTMLGGKIIGHRVVVEELTLNTTIIASESIEIYKITGEHNKLIIDPNIVETYHEKIEGYKQEIKTIKSALFELKPLHAKKAAEHISQIERIKTFKKKILLAQKAGKTANKADVIRLRQYQKETERLQVESQYISDNDRKIEEIEGKLEKLYEADLHGKIINRSVYDGKTQVVFIDVKTTEEHAMSPKGIYEEIYLVQEDGEKKLDWK